MEAAYPQLPWTKNKEGRGPAWANSLFEDNAEFGLGFRLAVDKQTEYTKELVKKLAATIGEELVNDLINARQVDEADIFLQRERVEILKKKIAKNNSPEAQHLRSLADMLVKKAFGLLEVTVGLMISGMADWTMSWPREKTSISSFWIQKFTQIPAGRPLNRHRARPSRNSPPAENRCRKRFSAYRHDV